VAAKTASRRATVCREGFVCFMSSP
jgi:hypothetical protein